MEPSSLFRVIFHSLQRFASLLIVLALIPRISSAQNPDTLHAAVSYDVFPMGGMINRADTVQRMLGTNFWWNGFPGPKSVGTLAGEAQVTDKNVAIRDPFYYDTTASVTDSQAAYNYYLLDAASANDTRIFMSGTSGKTKEYNHSWGINAGGFVDSNKVEWWFNVDGLITSGQYVLQNLDGGAQSDPIYGDGYGHPTLYTNHIGSTSYEFVFYFDPIDLGGVGSTTPLYSIEYWKHSDSSLLAVDTITKTLYNGLSEAITQAPGHNVRAEVLSTWQGQPNHHYRFLRRVLNTRSLVLAGGDAVDVRVRTFKQIRMYFRLLRIRDWRAQRLMSGKADSVLAICINALKTQSPNALLRSWTIGNEPQPKSFHAWAYVNDLLAKNNAPRANVLAPYLPDLFLRVAHDQTQFYDKPAHIWYEWTPASGDAWKGAGKDNSDGHSYWYWGSGPGYASMPNPIPGDVATDSSFWSARSVFIQKDYSTYTNLWQDTILGYASETSGGGRGQSQDFLNIAQSCFELDSLHPAPFELMGQAIAGSFQQPKWNPVDSLYWVKNGIYDPAALAYADTAYDTQVIRPYLARHPGQTRIPEDSLYELVWQWRPPTVSEMYYSLWSGIAHGIRGYGYNILYDDGELQNGLLWDSLRSGSQFIKTQDRSYIEFNFGGALWNPYEMGNASKWFENAGYTTYEVLPPAFKTMFPTARTLMTQELAPLAQQLSRIQWRGSVTWTRRDSVPTYFGRLPVRNVQTRTLSGSLDSASKTYVEFGVHKDPTDTSAIYVTMQNRRLWIDSVGTSTIDSRKISFKVDSSKFHGYGSWTEWSIRDASGRLPEQVIGASDSAVYTLKAGQGILLRIAPVTGAHFHRSL